MCVCVCVCVCVCGCVCVCVCRRVCVWRDRKRLIYNSICIMFTLQLVAYTYIMICLINRS